MEIEKGDEPNNLAPIFVVPKHPEDTPFLLAVGDGADSREKKRSSEDIKTLLNRRNELEKQLQECEDEIYNMETNYFERAASNGNCNVIAGWYGFITPTVGAASVKHSMPNLTASVGYGSQLNGSGSGRDVQGTQSQQRKSGSGGVGAVNPGGAAGLNGAYKLRDSDRIFSLSSVTSKASIQTFQNTYPNVADTKKTVKYK